MKQFNKDRFEQILLTEWLGRSFLCFDELESTNTYLKEQSNKLTHGTLVLADSQTAGRGQAKKVWISEAGTNLTFSFLLKPDNIQGAHLLTLSFAYAIQQVLKKYLSTSEVCIKWPNDILVDGKKICGLLTESRFQGLDFAGLIIGIGLNINQMDFSAVDQAATSLAIECLQEVRREDILADVCKEIEINYNRWLDKDEQLHKEINSKFMYAGQAVKATVNDIKDYYALFVGVNQDGELILLNEDDNLLTFGHEQIKITSDQRVSRPTA